MSSKRRIEMDEQRLQRLETKLTHLTGDVTDEEGCPTCHFCEHPLSRHVNGLGCGAKPGACQVGLCRDVRKLRTEDDSLGFEQNAMKQTFHDMISRVNDLLRTSTSSGSPAFISERLTPVRKFVDFSKEELQYLNRLLGEEMTRELESDGPQDSGLVDLYNRTLEILSEWEDEAHQNGEFF